MSFPARELIPNIDFERLRHARSILQDEGQALLQLADDLGDAFCNACEQILRCEGTVVVTGMGKAGLIGQKIAATMSSTGTRARFLHPAEAVHGDLGCLVAGDVVLALSNSGETDEVNRLLPVLRQLGAVLIAITATTDSTLGKACDVVVPLGRLREAGPHGLAPTTSTTAMLGVGDALALVVSRERGFTPRDFAVFHPAGSLGAKLKTVREVMRSGEDLRIAPESASIRDVFIAAGKPGRRTGAVMLLNSDGRLSGLFTDSDLARLLEHRREADLDGPIVRLMTRNPLTVQPDVMLTDVVHILSDRKLSEIPVVDDEQRPIGLIDITDIIGFLPQADDSPSAHCA